MTIDIARNYWLPISPEKLMPNHDWIIIDLFFTKYRPIPCIPADFFT